MIFLSAAATRDVHLSLRKLFFQHFARNRSEISLNLLRSYSGECLGSSSDEERSELRYSIWIAEFRELVDLWTHAAFWLTPVCSFTGVYNSFSVTISVVSLRARFRKRVGASNSSRRLHCCQASCSLLTNSKALVIHSCWVHLKFSGFRRASALLVLIVLLLPFTQHNPV